MAAVFVPPSPQTSFAMSSRRPPLANVPNAANSPHHGSTATAVKRARTGSQIDLAFGQPPPKKQLVDHEDGTPRSPVKSRTTIASQGAESKVFSRRANTSQATAFEKRLIAAREKDRQLQPRGSKHEGLSAEALDNIRIRQWQRHYRKAFPGFVFYFDSIPADVRSRSLREVLALGAREERFFSRIVTHVVTSRPIPDADAPSPLESPTIEQTPGDGLIQTVNPSLLEKNDHRKDQANNTDVLYRARQMGMKIWAIEKLQRMLAAIHEADTPASYTGARAGSLNPKGRGEAELSQVLRNECLHGPSDRDPSQIFKDMVLFKGPYIYVHDMDQKTRPVMVREYPKVAKRQDGAWPQFRSAPLGKCPFIEEVPSKKEIARMKEERRRAPCEPIVKAEGMAKKVETRGGDDSNTQEDEGVVPLTKAEDMAEPTNQPEPPKAFTVPPVSPRKSSESFIAPTLTRTGPFGFGREPAASGVQPSNITSAIRSQMISSTAAAPGAKTGLSKEVHELKRKVLEKSNGTISTGAGLSSHRPADASGMRTMSGMSSRSKRPADKLGHVHEEDATQSEDAGGQRTEGGDRRDSQQKKIKEKKRDPKPGYCENCRDKFDDFDEHVLSRKHRKFAANLANWTELDALLAKLKRPQKSSMNILDDYLAKSAHQRQLRLSKLNQT